MRIDLAGWTREATRGPHRDFLALFEEADRLGFDGVWFNEFHFQDPPQPYPSILLLAAAVFARTGRIRVGASVVVLPLHQPMLLAEEIAQLDFQSGGRIDVGLGRGTKPETFDLLGIPQDSARQRYVDGYHALIRTWAGAAPTTQKPHPPLYIAGYTRETLAFAVEQEAPLLLSLEPNEARQIVIYDELLAQTGKPSRIAASSLSRYVCIGRTAAEARALVDRLAAEVRRRREALERPFDLETMLADQVVWGDPEACVAQIEALGRRLGPRALRCVFNGNGLFGNAEALAGMRLFAREALPAVQSLS